MTTTEHISRAKAQQLVDSGMWMVRSILSMELESDLECYLAFILNDERLRKRFERSSNPHEKRHDLIMYGEEYPTRLELPYSRTRCLLDEVARLVDCKKVVSGVGRSNPTLSEIHVGEGLILKIGPTLRRSKYAWISVVAAGMAIADSSSLIGALSAGLGAAQNVSDLFTALSEAFERLTDSKEVLIFETVFMIQSKRLALCSKTSVAMEEIEQAVATHPIPEKIPEEWRDISAWQLHDEILKTTNELCRRHVLKKRDGGWNITLKRADKMLDVSATWKGPEVFARPAGRESVSRGSVHC